MATNIYEMIRYLEEKIFFIDCQIYSGCLSEAAAERAAERRDEYQVRLNQIKTLLK